MEESLVDYMEELNIYEHKAECGGEPGWIYKGLEYKLRKLNLETFACSFSV